MHVIKTYKRPMMRERVRFERRMKMEFSDPKPRESLNRGGLGLIGRQILGNICSK